MTLIDERYEFRLAGIDDVDAIMAFYREEWGADHILATDREYFCYQHVVDDKVNFMLAIHRETGQIHAAEGFIQYSQQLCDVGAVMWKVGSRCRTPLLGVDLVRRLKQATGCRVYLGPGANPKTAVPLHRHALKHEVGLFDHYYMLADRDHYSIAVVGEKPPVKQLAPVPTMTLSPLKSLAQLEGRFDFSAWFERKPYKDDWYVRRRYFENPIYRYDVFAVTGEDKIVRALLVARAVSIGDACILRIVDVLGDTRILAGLGEALHQLMDEHDYEYIDLYCKGLEHADLITAGFVLKERQGPNIIPNYFEPFMQSNVDIWYSLSDADTVLFKADGDQDRPNSRVVNA